MNVPVPLAFCLALQTAAVSATEQIVTLGDSLTFAYEAEFCFSKSITGYGTIGDGFGPGVRNWIEILNNPTYRGDKFNLGTRDSITVDPPLDPPFDLYFRQAQNWAIPGLKIDGLRRFLTGEASFRDLLDDDPGFSTIDLIFDYSDYAAADFALSDLQSQIQGTAERMTIFVGGNDIKEVYGTIYSGGSAGTFVADFMADMVAVLDIVQALNPNLQIVLVNVPHIGITPQIRGLYTYDSVKTERVSAVLRDLNGQLANLAASRNLGYADIYTPILSLYVSAAYPLCIYGFNFSNSGTAVDNVGPVWLNGPISANFHPNTNAQAVIANEIILAFNKRYQTGIAPLSATEILGGLLGKSAGEIDMTFTTWMTRYFFPSSPPPSPSADDSDGDGIPAAVEFALGLSPKRHDSERVSSGIAAGALELAYPVRVPGSTKFTLTPESSTDLTSGFTPFVTLPTPGTDGLSRARLTLGSGPGFLRLKSSLAP